MSRDCTTASDYIEQGSVAIPQTGSLQIWVFPHWAQTDNAQHIFVGTQKTGVATVDFDLQHFSDNKLYCGWNTLGGVDSRVIVASAGYTLNQNTWNHIVLTWTSGGTCTLYLNGTSIGTSTSISTYSTAGSTRVIGADNDHVAGVTVNARLAEFAIWNVVLTSTEVSNLYNSGANAQLASQEENGALVDYLPLWGLVDANLGLESAIVGTSGTLTGTAKAAHAPIVTYLIQRSTSLTAGATSLDTSFGATPAVNNTVLVRAFGLKTSDLTGALSVKDNQTPSNTYKLAKFRQDGTSPGEWAVEFYAKAAVSSGTFTVTFTSTVSIAFEVEILEVYPTLFLDQTNAAVGSSVNPAAGSVGITNAPQFVTSAFGCDESSATATVTAPSGYLMSSAIQNNVNQAIGGVSVSTKGKVATFNPTWTIDTSSHWAAIQVTYSITALASSQPPIGAFAHQANNRLASPQVGRAA